MCLRLRLSLHLWLSRSRRWRSRLWRLHLRSLLLRLCRPRSLQTTDANSSCTYNSTQSHAHPIHGNLRRRRSSDTNTINRSSPTPLYHPSHIHPHTTHAHSHTRVHSRRANSLGTLLELLRLLWLLLLLMEGILWRWWLLRRMSRLLLRHLLLL